MSVAAVRATPSTYWGSSGISMVCVPAEDTTVLVNFLSSPVERLRLRVVVGTDIHKLWLEVEVDIHKTTYRVGVLWSVSSHKIHASHIPGAHNPHPGSPHTHCMWVHDLGLGLGLRLRVRDF